ncbi:MAG: hypothetical protein WBJ08_00235 [Kiritimatiellia bacterium]
MAKIYNTPPISILAAGIIATLASIHASSHATPPPADPDNHWRDKAIAIINTHTPQNTITVTHVNSAAALITIRLHHPDIFSTDAGCALFGTLAQELCALESKRCILHVENAAPTSVNPMDYTWAQELAAAAGAPIPIPADAIQAHQTRVITTLANRGIHHPPAPLPPRSPVAP